MVTIDIHSVTAALDRDTVGSAAETVKMVKREMRSQNGEFIGTPGNIAVLQLCIKEGAERPVTPLEFRLVNRWFEEYSSQRALSGDNGGFEIFDWNTCVSSAVQWFEGDIQAVLKRTGRRVCRQLNNDIMEKNGVIATNPNGTFTVSRWEEYLPGWTTKHIYEVSPMEIKAIESIVRDEILGATFAEMGLASEAESSKQVANGWFTACQRHALVDLDEQIQKVMERAFNRSGLDEHWCDRKNAANTHEDAIMLMSKVKSLFSINLYNEMAERYEHLEPLLQTKQTGLIGIWLARVMRGNQANGWMSNMNHPADLISLVRDSTQLDKINWKRLVRMPIEEVVEDMWELADIDRDFQTFVTLFKMETMAGVRPSRVAYDTVKRHLFPENRGVADYVRLATPEHYTHLVVEYWKKSVETRNGEVDQMALMQRFESILDWALHRILRDVDAAVDDLTPENIPEVPKYSWRRYTDESNRWHRDQIVAQRERERVKYLEDTKVRWDSAVEQFESGIYTVVPLTNRAMMILEGTKMDHCVGSGGYTNQCVEGVSRIFSIRMTNDLDGRPIGTAQLSKRNNNEWYLAQLRGPHNHDVTDDVKKVGAKLPGMYRDAERNYHAAGNAAA